MAACNVIIDLSHNNANVDLAQAKAGGVQGIIHKATQGTGFSDPTYSARRRVEAGRPPMGRVPLRDRGRSISPGQILSQSSPVFARRPSRTGFRTEPSQPE